MIPPVSVLTTDETLRQAYEHHRAGRLEPAEGLYRQVLARQAAHADALVALVALLLQTAKIDEARRLLDTLIGARPRDLQSYLAAGQVMHVHGALDDAAAIYQRALAMFPRNDELCYRLGHVERGRRHPDAAMDWFRRAIETRPAFAEAHANLGLLLEEARRPQVALRHLDAALRLDEARPEVHYNRGITLTTLARLDEAAAAYRRAVALHPQFSEAWNNLGAVLKARGKLDDAVAAFQAALRAQPSWAATHSNLAGVYEWQARHDDALASHRRAIAAAPASAGTHGNCLFTLLFHPGFDAAMLRAEHAEWNRRHAQSLLRDVEPHANDRTPARRLRVGYVCGLLRDHVLGRYLLPLLREHDRSDIEVIAYSNNAANDALTDHFRTLTDEWRDIGHLADLDAAALIRRDRVDILVDTSLHMEGNRLLVFARRPAPVQVTFAGYPGSTGLQAIDYRLTDRYLDPPDRDDDVYAEHSWRLPNTFWCYDPVSADNVVGALPADANGYITFGSMNNFSKTNDGVWRAWAQVMRAVAHSRLLVLAHEGSHRARAVQLLQRLGVDPARVEFVAYRPRGEYLALFNRVDISLDTVPYNAHTTGLDSLWMGVPVVTLAGSTVVGRAGLSQLMNLQLPQLIASTTEEYIAIASDLARDLPRLRDLRRTLRPTMERSPLMDAKGFARDIEAAYRAMWRRWCDGLSATAGP